MESNKGSDTSLYIYIYYIYIYICIFIYIHIYICVCVCVRVCHIYLCINIKHVSLACCVWHAMAPFQLANSPPVHRRAAETFPHPDRSHGSVRVGSLPMSKKSRFIMFKNYQKLVFGGWLKYVEIPDLVNMQLQNVPAVALRCRTIYALIP